MDEQEQKNEAPVDVAAELQKIRDEYEKKLTEKERELQTEKAAHVRDVREILLHGKSPEPERDEQTYEPPRPEITEDERIANEIAEKMKRIYKGR